MQLQTVQQQRFSWYASLSAGGQEILIPDVRENRATLPAIANIDAASTCGKPVMALEVYFTGLNQRRSLDKKILTIEWLSRLKRYEEAVWSADIWWRPWRS